jgi:hypothetical protein
LKTAAGTAAVAVLLALVTSACGVTTSSPSSSSVTQSHMLQQVTSTLDGETTIPLRTRWIATPQPAGAPVAGVDFLIDGKVIWSENAAPYVFGGDDNGTNLGFLITSWLSPGAHTFTARATGVDGKTVSDDVTASVAAAPAPPAALKGTWTRTVTQQDIEHAGVTEGPPPTGQWHLIFDQIGAWELDPLGSGVGSQYEAQGDTLNVYAPIQEAPFSNGIGGISVYGHHDVGGTDCDASGPFGSYRWSVAGKKLTMSVINEGCPNRQAIWEGVWSLESLTTPPA